MLFSHLSYLYNFLHLRRGLIDLCATSLQDGNNNEISKREKERLKEMEKLKKHKIQEILDAQNAAIDADMVCLLYNSSIMYLLLNVHEKLLYMFANF